VAFLPPQQQTVCVSSIYHRGWQRSRANCLKI